MRTYSSYASMPIPLLIIIIPLLGLLAGIIISNLAAEELKPGRRYLVVLRRVFLLLLAFLLLWKATILSTASIASFLAGILISFIPLTRYVGIGFAIVIAFTLPQELMVAIASLAALYGLPY